METTQNPSAPVVVGYDGSSDGDLAFSWGERIAAAEQRPLRVVIGDLRTTDVLEITARPYRERLRAVEERARERAELSPVEDVSVEVVPGAPASSLIAASQGARLVVVGGQGHGAVFGLLIGSVSQHVARHAACPVLVTRPPRDPDANRVVVGVDGSAHSRQSVGFAAEQAAMAGATLTVVHVVPFNAGVASTALFGDPAVYARDLRAEGAKVIEEQVSGVRESHPELTLVPEVALGAPGRVLSDASRAASLVVVGSRGVGEFAGMLLGSVSGAVLHHARCPVAVVR